MQDKKDKVDKLKMNMKKKTYNENTQMHAHKERPAY